MRLGAQAFIVLSFRNWRAHSKKLFHRKAYKNLSLLNIQYLQFKSFCCTTTTIGKKQSKANFYYHHTSDWDVSCGLQKWLGMSHITRDPVWGTKSRKSKGIRLQQISEGDSLFCALILTNSLTSLPVHQSRSCFTCLFVCFFLLAKSSTTFRSSSTTFSFRKRSQACWGRLTSHLMMMLSLRDW